MALPMLLLAGVFGSTPSWLLKPMQLAQAQTPASKALIPVSLPYLADVTTKSGTLTGQVTALDPKSQTIKLSYSGGSREIKIADINSVVKFRPDANVCCRQDGKLIIRGDDKAVAKTSTWSGLSLGALQLIDPSKGLAKVSLVGVKKPIEIRGIQSVAQSSLYIVNQIKFSAVGQMTLTVTPVDR